MRQRWDLSGEWTLRGWRQHDWRWETSFVRMEGRNPDVAPVPARVPGSVRGALHAAGIIASPYDGVRSRESEWIENRHWTFTTDLPTVDISALPGDARFFLRAESLDYSGAVLLDDREFGQFEGAMTPVSIDVTEGIRAGARTLTIVFTSVPDDLGQIGWTSRVRQWKARYHFGWDWTPRVVQIGIAGPIALEAVQGNQIGRLNLAADYDPAGGTGTLRIRASTDAGTPVSVVVAGPGVDLEYEAPGDGTWAELEVGPVCPWQVHADEQALYTVTVRAPAGDEQVRRVGFRNLHWLPTEDAPADAEPWLLTVNGEPVFLAGVNWVPIRPDYADVTEDDYRRRLEEYRAIGVNTLRVWGGAARESDAFFRLTDEYGFLVWQELPLSSSGLDNIPPQDEQFAAEYAAIARAYVDALMHHPSIALWGGGNELASTGPDIDPLPATRDQLPFAAGEAVFADADPGRRFVPTSPLGPSVWAFQEHYGKGIHHDVHGPWEFAGTFEEWRAYWDSDDALLRSEVGVSGASSYDLLTRHGLVGPTGTAQEREALAQLWTHSAAWWLKPFRAWDGSGPLEEWVEASQHRQAQFLAYAARTARSRFPRCGGFIVWLGHDTFPCPVSLSILDFDGAPKPVAGALGEIFLGSS